MRKLRVGFVGAGGICRGAHLPAFQALSDECEIVAAADVAQDALDACALAADYGQNAVVCGGADGIPHLVWIEDSEQ